MRHSRIQHLCWLFSGAEISLLRECPTDYNRQASIGFTILMTCLFAALSGGYAAWRFTLNRVGEGNMAATIGFGLVWGLLIFSIDRSMVVTLKKDPTKEKQSWVAPLLTRMVLAALLAFMVSIPLETKLFEKEIALQAQRDIQKGIAEGKQLAEQNIDAKASEDRRKQKTADRQEAETRANLAYAQIPGWSEQHQIAVNAARERVPLLAEAAQKQRQAATLKQKSWHPPYEDRNVTPPRRYRGYFDKGSPSYRRAGELFSEVSRINKRADNLEKTESGANKKAQQIADTYKRQAASDAAVARKEEVKSAAERDVRQARIDTVKSEFERVAKDRGFISAFVSMENAAQADGHLLFFLWFIRFLFFTIEILPTIVKLATPLGEYDRQLHAHEQMFALALTTNYRILQEREQLRQETELSIAQQLEQLRQEKEVELGQNVLTETARRQNELAQQMLKKWYAQEKAKLTPAPPAPVPAPAPARNGQAAAAAPSVATAPPTVGPAPASLPTTAPAAPVASPATSAPVAGANGATAPPTAIAPPSVVLPAASQVPATLLASVPSVGRKPSLTGKNWQREDVLANEVYRFFDGSATENSVERTTGTGRPVSGKWSFANPEESAISMKFNGEEKEYIVRSITPYQLHLADSLNDKLIKFRSV